MDWIKRTPQSHIRLEGRDLRHARTSTDFFTSDNRPARLEMDVIFKVSPVEDVKGKLVKKEVCYITDFERLNFDELTFFDFQEED